MNQQMQSDEYEYYSDSSIEEINEQPSDARSIYNNITKHLSKLIKQKPLSNNLPLSDSIQSRITVLTDLYIMILTRYKCDITHSQFRILLEELRNAIYGIAKIVDDMESKIEELEYLSDSGDRYIRLFPSPIDGYLYDTRRKIINEFNDFISDEDWLVFEFNSKKTYKQLPLLDKLKIPEDLI